ncbi:MAG: addiction module antidote protein [Rhodanobacteraceae bacterium]
MHTTTGKTTKHAASIPFDAADLLQADDVPGFLAEVMADGDTSALPLALRTAADVLGMAELARRAGLNRETLYRTLSASGNPRLNTLGAILQAFNLRLVVKRAAKARPEPTRKGKLPKKKPAMQPARKRA